MSRLLVSIVRLGLVVGLASTGLVGCGTDSDEACEIVCSKNAECQPGSDKDVCLSDCHAQAKDEDFADAIIEQSECYEDASCSDVNSNVCVPQDI